MFSNITFHLANVVITFVLTKSNNLSIIGSRLVNIFLFFILSAKILNATIENSVGNTVAYPVNITRNTSGTPGNGLGAGIEFYIENSANANVAYGSLEIVADDVTDDSENGKFVVNRKATIYSLMFNSYLDFPINDQFQVFAGAGLGIARIDEKGNLELTALNNTKTGDKIKSKKKQNFAYSLTTGISYKIADNTNIELSYKWSDYGKTKFKDKDVTKNRYRGHSILTGIRYSM